MGSEKAFEKRVKEFLKQQNCWVLKTWSNGVQRSGVPDLLVCCNGVFLGIELKAQKRKTKRTSIVECKENKGIGRCCDCFISKSV